jgi:probable HAF family extracellular repeat protein
MHTRRLIATLLGLAGMTAPALPLRADDKATLIELQARSDALPSAVNASGAMIVGGLGDGGGFYWMPTTGAIYNGGVTARGVSRDGQTIVGIAADTRRVQQAAIWLRAAEWQLLGSFTPASAPCDLFLSNAAGTNADGQVVVGLASNGCTYTHAFRWEAATGMVDLGTAVEGRSTAAMGVSGDGKVVVGYQQAADGFQQGARWVEGRQERIPGPAEDSPGYVGPAHKANHDGSIIVGRVCRPVGAQRPPDQSAWVWTPDDATHCLPAPRLRVSPGPPILVEANGTSDDGRVIGGGHSVGGSPDSNAVIWIDRSPAYLKDFLQANGVPKAFEQWINTGSITDVSPDGRILVGWGAAPGGYRGYIVILGSSRVMP